MKELQLHRNIPIHILFGTLENIAELSNTLNIAYLSCLSTKDIPNYSRFVITAVMHQAQLDHNGLVISLRVLPLVPHHLISRPARERFFVIREMVSRVNVK